MSLTQAVFLPVPECCHACASEDIRKTKIKSGREAWVCDSCDAFVLCHVGVDNPVGYMAGEEIRALRKQAHSALDILWQERLMSRDRAYLWLAAQMNIPRTETHISWMTKAQLETVVALASEYYREHGDNLRRRAEKKQANRKERYDRENAAERRKIIERKRNRRT